MSEIQYLWSELTDLVARVPEAVAWLHVIVVIGTVGAWRWTMWLCKRGPGLLYRPIRNDFTCTSTVVTAVYQEDPVLFRKALESWIANRPDRILAVIDVTDGRCLAVAREYAAVEVIVSRDPGKRPKLAAGVDAANTDIVVLVDSDVIWTDGVMRKVMMPFRDPKIGGVGTRAYMVPTNGERATLWERLADIFVEVRYSTEVAATTRWGRAVGCLSGRTAAYRTTLLKEVRDEFLNERFFGKLCISGDDKCYTMLALKRGYRTWHQLDAHVYSTFKPTVVGFVQQRLRWTRNSFRSDFKALGSGWLWRHPYLALVLLDKNLGLLTQLNGPIAFLLAFHAGHWRAIAALLAWWHLSRAIKIASHLRRRPWDIFLLPAFIGVTFGLSLMKFYAFFTMNKQGWLTRPVTMDADGQVVRTPAAS